MHSCKTSVIEQKCGHRSGETSSMVHDTNNLSYLYQIRNYLSFQMNFSYNGGQFPYQWQTANRYGYSGQQPQHAGTPGPPPAPLPPLAPAGPPGYLVAAPAPGTQAIVGKTGNIRFSLLIILLYTHMV